MTQPSDQKLREEIVNAIASMVRAGFRTPAEILESVDDIAGDAADPQPYRAFAVAELDRALIARRGEQAKWPERTDCDRLDQAFEELETTGIICRQDFTCCGNCGNAEIGGEIEAFEAKRGLTARGYTFYHMQDTERAVEGGALYLNYGSAEPGAEPALAIAREIVATLVSHGLAPEWDGDIRTRIHLPLEWRRRFVCT